MGKNSCSCCGGPINVFLFPPTWNNRSYCVNCADRYRELRREELRKRHDKILKTRIQEDLGREKED